MPFVPVPKDLSKVKTKVAFNLTKRQIICFGLGGLVGIPAYLLSRGSIGNEPAVALMVGLMLPFFVLGIFEKDGKPLEKVLWDFISVSLLRPPERPYRTDNGYAALVRQYEHDKEVDAIGSRKKGKARKAGEKTAGCRKGEHAGNGRA